MEDESCQRGYGCEKLMARTVLSLQMTYCWLSLLVECHYNVTDSKYLEYSNQYHMDATLWLT